MESTIKNRVAESGIITLNIEAYLPREPIVELDIKAFLFREMILKEKEFRAMLKETDWSVYAGKNVGIVCSADAIIPQWAYMLLVRYLQPVAAYVMVGHAQQVAAALLQQRIAAIPATDYTDARVVIKGCGEQQVGAAAYAEITRVLLPVVKSIMYGEPCSAVPVYKRK